MKIAVIGAGVIGVTTAFELASDGHQVVVFERHGGVAEESSFGNAGVVAPGYVTPWAAPGMPGKVARYLFTKHAPVRVSLPLGRREIDWIRRWKRACDPDIYRANRVRMQRLAFYSRERLHLMAENLQLDYGRGEGYLVLLRGAKEVELVRPGLDVLREAGVAFREVDAAEARRIEPALNPDTPLAGAIHLPDDEVGNCRQFAVQLRWIAQDHGVHFEFHADVAPLDRADPTRVVWRSSGGAEPREHRFDAVAVCGGVSSVALLASLGIDVPLVPVHGYSISATIGEPLNAPRAGLMDERYKVAVTRLGSRLRVAGSAEIGGRPGRHHPAAIATLYQVLADWFPAGAKLSARDATVQAWKGARPMLPDGPPVLGATGIPGVWINLGHGSSGWALACGSARVVADLIGGRPAEVDLEGLGIERLSR